MKPFSANYLFALLLLFHCNVWGQSDVITANFSYPDVKATIFPEFPAFCDSTIGIKVRCNEDFINYKWKKGDLIFHQGTKSDSGHTVVIKKEGKNYSLEVSYVANNITCTKVIKFEVTDLSDASKIKNYFRSAGFYEVKIFRDNPPPVLRNEDTGIRNPSVLCKLEDIKFQPVGSTINFHSVMSQAISEFAPLQWYTSKSGMVSNNGCLCNPDGTSTIPQLEQEFVQGEVKMWGHQFFQNNNNESKKVVYF